MFEVNIVKIGKINIHFAYVVEKLGSVECSFRLKNKKNCYITSAVDGSEFDKEFGDFSLLENKNFRNWPEWREFLENYVIGQFENDSLVDTDQKDFGRLLSVGFPVAKTAVRRAMAHIKKLLINYMSYIWRIKL